MRLDVLVVGAGPAGVAAGLTAHSRGLRTLVVDKASFPRDKTCGDGLTAEALRRLEHLGVPIPVLDGSFRVSEVVLMSPSGRRVTLPLPVTGLHSAVVPRHELDAALVARAREAGVEVREGAAITSITDTEHSLAATVGGQPVDAAYVIAADGHWSSVRRLREQGAPADLGTWHAARQYFTGVDDPRQWVVFEEDLLPGYAWVFPLPGGRANVGFGVLRAPGLTGKRLNALWTDVLGRPSLRSILGPRAEPEATTRAWPIPSAFDPARLSDGRVLYAGDAAGVVDPMTGEGIAQALETGTLAAEAVASGAAPPGTMARYRDAVEQRLGRDLRFAALLQRVLRNPLGARVAIRAADVNPWTRRSFARWMFEDYPRAVVLTPGRWRRGMFDSPGAFATATAPPRS
jgi:menaquinone-9 beta-reductase